MANYRGQKGSVKFATNAVGELKSWTMQSDVEMLEDTAMGDDWRTFVGGLGSWSGTAVAQLDYGDTLGQKAMIDKILAATPASGTFAIQFLADTGKLFGGNVLVSGLSISAGLGNIIEISFSFQGSGALTPTWA